MVIGEIRCGIKKLIYKQLQIKTVIITYGGVTEIFCMADDFCKFFDAMTAKYTLKPTGKRKHHRDSMMSNIEVMLVMNPFYDSGCRCFIETVNDELKTLRKWNTPDKDALTISSSTFRSNCCLLLVSKEAVHQYTKNH